MFYQRPIDTKLNFGEGKYDLLFDVPAKTGRSSMQDLDVHEAYHFFEVTFQSIVDTAVSRSKTEHSLVYKHTARFK